jgi:predicted permease
VFRGRRGVRLSAEGGGGRSGAGAFDAAAPVHEAARDDRRAARPPWESRSEPTRRPRRMESDSPRTSAKPGNGVRMSRLLADLKQARRQLVKSPLFTAVVVGTLAIGIGLNTAVFSTVDALLLRPLPGVRSPEELVQAYRTYQGGHQFGSNSIPHFNSLRERSGHVFSGVATFGLDYLSLSASDRPRRVMGSMVSANYFSVLGVGAARGRVFTPDEDVGRGAHPVVVLSDAGWKGLFAGDPNVVGRSIVLNGKSYTVVGVTPPEFKGALPVLTPTLWVPLMQLADVRPGDGALFDSRGRNNLFVIARLRAGVDIALARDRMTALMAELRSEYPDSYKNSGVNLVLQSRTGIHPMFKDAQVGLSAVVMAVVGILLLIACANVANIFLARARTRDREMAIRLSVGAGRGDLVRQLLTESFVFAVAAGLAGLAVALWAMGLANRIVVPTDMDFGADLRLSPSILVFTLGVTAATGLLFGLVPALQATRPALVPALKGEAPAGASRSRVSWGLVVAQTALSIILLVCAGLFLRNLKAAASVDKGFVSDNLYIAEVDPELQGYSRARSEDFYRRLIERLRSAPGVRAVGLGDRAPLSLGSSDRSVEIAGYTPGPNEFMSIQFSTVAPGYFEALGIPIVRGRGFTAQDDSAAPGALVVNQAFVARYSRGQEMLGRTVRFGGRDHAVIGVVPTGKYLRLGEDPTPFMYQAQAQHWNSGMTFFVRTAGEPTAVAATLRSEVAALDPNLPLSNARAMNSHLGIALLPSRLVGGVLGIFGLLALGLAAVGIYGVVAYTVAQRTREIGIRMALGADALDAVLLVMRQGLAPVALGTGLGLVGALAASRLLRSVLYGGSALDPVTFVAVPLVLVGVAVLATWIPARRAAGVNPVLALRQE